MDVANELARVFGVRERDVGYGGMKDRHAKVTQTFTVLVPAQKRPGLPCQRNQGNRFKEQEPDEVSEMESAAGDTTTLPHHKSNQQIVEGEPKESEGKRWKLLIEQIPAFKVHSIARCHKKIRKGQLWGNQ